MINIAFVCKNNIYTDFDSVYFTIIFDIHVYQTKTSTKATTDINQSNIEIFSVIDTLVIDICQRTQTEKTLFDKFF